MKFLLALLFCCACVQAIAETYTLVIRTQVNMPDASETWNQQPVNLATMNGMFYVGPFTDLSLCQAYRTNGVTGMFDNLAYNTIPIIVSITELRCEATSSLP